MQSFRAVAAARRSLRRFSFLSNHATFSAQPHYTDIYLQDEVLVEGKANARAAILNRPSNLNALTTSMVSRLKKLYESWEENNDIGFVIMKGSGRAFCAGGDVVALRQFLNEGKVEDCKEFFRTLYNFIYLLGTYMKPHVAILDGITMGPGGGISFPGTFRVATDKTVFGNPETHIGFHPDSGASFYLSRLPGYLGEYLALTGDKLNGVDMIACGLATHYCLNARLAWIEERLGKLITDDPSIIEASLEQYGDLVYPDTRSVLHNVLYGVRKPWGRSCYVVGTFINFVIHLTSPLAIKIETIDKCFGQDTVEEIIDALENEAANTYDEWCTSALKKLKEASPLSLKVSLRSIREGRFQSLDQCLAREYRTTLHVLANQVSQDFSEGVRARLVDKDYAPKWDPPSLEDVSKDMVNYYFAPLSEIEPELELPTALREPFV